MCGPVYIFSPLL
uniref:Uncharacterized protein n=1 Tax=Anguilla anguilla TaxID=7936 RepID=A0A0E9QYH6_ANGAN